MKKCKIPDSKTYTDSCNYGPSLNCPTCQKPYWDDGKSTSPKQTCKCYEKYEKYMTPTIIQVGWQCPCCGGGVAPGVERCPCKPMHSINT
jgi:hypothetical protein